MDKLPRAAKRWKFVFFTPFRPSVPWYFPVRQVHYFRAWARSQLGNPMPLHDPLLSAATKKQNRGRGPPSASSHSFPGSAARAAALKYIYILHTVIIENIQELSENRSSI